MSFQNYSPVMITMKALNRGKASLSQARSCKKFSLKQIILLLLLCYWVRNSMIRIYIAPRLKEQAKHCSVTSEKGVFLYYGPATTIHQHNPHNLALSCLQYRSEGHINIRSAGSSPDFFLAYSNQVKNQVNKKIHAGVGTVYDSTTTNIMYTLIKGPCDLALDIGGNIGWYSGYFLSLGCKIISIEARDFMTSILNTTVYSNLNQEGLRAEVWNRAVASDSVGKVYMKDFEVVAEGGEKSVVDVQKASILDIFEKSQIIADLKGSKKVIDISMIKIDIEGSELHALKSLAILLKTNNFRFSNIFVELKPALWSQFHGFDYKEASEIFEVFFDAGYCLRKLLYSECCKGIYKTKTDHACCKGSSEKLWPNWKDFRDVPDDIFGDIFSTASQMKPYFDNPDLRSTRTAKKALDGDFFLSKSAICTHGVLSYPNI